MPEQAFKYLSDFVGIKRIYEQKKLACTDYRVAALEARIEYFKTKQD